MLNLLLKAIVFLTVWASFLVSIWIWAATDLMRFFWLAIFWLVLSIFMAAILAAKTQAPTVTAVAKRIRQE